MTLGDKTYLSAEPTKHPTHNPNAPVTLKIGNILRGLYMAGHNTGRVCLQQCYPQMSLVKTTGTSYAGIARGWRDLPPDINALRVSVGYQSVSNAHQLVSHRVSVIDDSDNVDTVTHEIETFAARGTPRSSGVSSTWVADPYTAAGGGAANRYYRDVYSLPLSNVDTATGGGSPSTTHVEIRVEMRIYVEAAGTNALTYPWQFFPRFVQVWASTDLTSTGGSL